MDYEKFLREKELRMQLWGKESLVLMDEEIELPKELVLAKLAWVEEHREEIIDFALEAEDFLDGINAAIEKDFAKKGSHELYDGTLLYKSIEREELVQSIYINSLYFGEYDFSVDLATSPDYFGGHLLSIDVDFDTSEMDYAGMNG